MQVQGYRQISRHLPDDQTDEERLDFFRRAIETLAVEANSELNLVVATCPYCNQPHLALASGRFQHHCSPNGYQL